MTAFDGVKGSFIPLQTCNKKAVLNIGYDLKTINNMLEILGSLVVHKPNTLITVDVVTNGCATPDMMTVVIDKLGI